MDTKQYETLMVNVLQRLINKAEQTDTEVLKHRFDNHPESKCSAFHIFIKRCKGHVNLITSPEWETLDASEQETIVKYAKKDTCTLEELVIKDIMRDDVSTLGVE